MTLRLTSLLPGNGPSLFIAQAALAQVIGRVSATRILPRWISNQSLGDSVPTHANFYFLQCRSRGAKFPVSDPDCPDRRL
jgi:hypothetical protein